MGAGFGMVGLRGLAGAETADTLAPKAPHFPPRAKRVIYLFLNGGPSQVDTFDPKPKLTEYHGKPIPSGNLRTERKTGNLLKEPSALEGLWKTFRGGADREIALPETAFNNELPIQSSRGGRGGAEKRGEADVRGFAALARGNAREK